VRFVRNSRGYLSDGLTIPVIDIPQFTYPLRLDWSYESLGGLTTVEGRASLSPMSMLRSRGERGMQKVKTRNATNDYFMTTIYN
jgi:hypothetical protein